MNPVHIVNYAAMPEIAIAIGIGTGIEKMVLGHEKLDVYRLAIGYVAWVFEETGKAQRTIPIPICCKSRITRTLFTQRRKKIIEKKNYK